MIIGEFNDVYPPTLDGVGMVVKSYCEALTNRGHECYYIAPNNPKYPDDANYKTLLYAGIKMIDEPYHFGLPFLDFKFLATQRKIDFDIIHAHSPFTSGMEARRQSGVRKTPIVATFHSKYYDDFYGKTHSALLATIGTKIVVDFYNRCDEVWTVSDKTAETLQSYGYKKDIFIMPNGTDIYVPSAEDKKRVDDEFHMQSDEMVFLFVGQMNWKKNIRFTLDAFKLYSSKHPSRLIMVGQGPDEKAIHEYAKEIGISERVIFTGHIGDRGYLLGIFCRADLFVFPSKYDTAGLVVREAASVGTPSILLRDTCAAECVRDGENGILCDDSPEAMCARIEQCRPDLERLGSNARDTIPIPWSSIAEKVENRYRYLIDRKKQALLKNK